MKAMKRLVVVDSRVGEKKLALTNVVGGGGGCRGAGKSGEGKNISNIN